MTSIRYGVAAILLAATSPAWAEDASFDRAVGAVRERMTTITQSVDSIPGSAIVAVEAGQAPIIDVRGTSKLGSNVSVTKDTPFYIASMTKAFVGLMAVQLDRRGIMQLDTPLALYFPGLKMTAADPAKITLRDLLAHRAGFTARALNVRTAYIDDVPNAEIPAILAKAVANEKPGFSYSNLGYLLYAAALEQKTGRSWKSWLAETVFEPLSMHHSSARSSDFDNIAWAHTRIGDRWDVAPPKRDAVMHAAGGLVVSADDMARFLSAELGEASAVPPAAITASQESQSDVSMSEGPMECDGYSFGWMHCAAFGERVLVHNGEYRGQRAIMMLAPSHHAAFAAMFNSDSMTGGLGQFLVLTFLANLAGKGDDVPDAHALAGMYGAQVENYRRNLAKEADEERAKPSWVGWKWKPSKNELLAYAGSYRNGEMGMLDVVVGGTGLEARLNGTSIALESAAPGLFAASIPALDVLPIQFKVAKGRIVNVTLDDFVFDPVAR